MRASGSFAIVAVLAWSATAGANVQPPASASGDVADRAPARAEIGATPSATGASARSRLWAQAEPAPADYVPPGRRHADPTTEPRKPDLHPWLFTVDASLPFKLGDLVPELPRIGWGAGVSIARSLAYAGPMRFGFGAQFAYQRMQREKTGMGTLDDGSPVALDFGKQFVGHTTFAGLLVMDGLFGRVRPWLNAGAGFDVAQYFDPAVSADQTAVGGTDVVGLIQVAAGLSVEITRGIEIGLGAHFDFLVSSRRDPVVGTKAPVYSVFAPGLFSLRLQLGFRF